MSFRYSRARARERGTLRTYNSGEYDLICKCAVGPLDYYLWTEIRGGRVCVCTSPASLAGGWLPGGGGQRQLYTTTNERRAVTI